MQNIQQILSVALGPGQVGRNIIWTVKWSINMSSGVNVYLMRGEMGLFVEKKKMNRLFEPLDILTRGLGGMHWDVSQVQQKGRMWEEHPQKVCVPSTPQETWWCGCTQERNEVKKELKQTVSAQSHADAIQNSFTIQVASWPFIRQ